MEKSKNRLRFVRNNLSLLPIEEEFLSSVKREIENKIKSSITSWRKYESHPIYDSYLIVAENTPLFLKVNLSPDEPNFWKELVENNFSFHPKIICHSDEKSEFKFICYEIPKGIFLSDISAYPLNKKLDLQLNIVKAISEMHKINTNADNTINIFDSFLPFEAERLFKQYPVASSFFTLKSLFKKTYTSNLKHCGLCHFDLCPENMILTNGDIKIINFEYAANANIYLDILLAKETLNCSDQTFDQVKNILGYEKNRTLPEYEKASELFNFAYFNSKIVSEYITFGLRNPAKLKYWINKSETFYLKIQNELFVSKSLDKLIKDFYLVWKS